MFFVDACFPDNVPCLVPIVFEEISTWICFVVALISYPSCHDVSLHCCQHKIVLLEVSQCFLLRMYDVFFVLIQCDILDIDEFQLEFVFAFLVQYKRNSLLMIANLSNDDNGHCRIHSHLQYNQIQYVCNISSRKHTLA